MSANVHNQPSIIEVFDPGSNRHSVGIRMSEILNISRAARPWGTLLKDLVSKQDSDRFPDYVLVNFSRIEKVNELMWIFENLPSEYIVTKKYNSSLERHIITKRRRILIGTGVTSMVPGRTVEIEPIENSGMEWEVATEIDGWNENTPPTFPIRLKTMPASISYSFPNLLKAIEIKLAWAWADSSSAAESYSEDYMFAYDLQKPPDGPFGGKTYRYLTDDPEALIEQCQPVKIITRFENPALVRAWYRASTKGNSTFAIAKELQIPESIHGEIEVGQAPIAKALGVTTRYLESTPNFDNIINAPTLIASVKPMDAGLGLYIVEVDEIDMTGIYDETVTSLRYNLESLGNTSPPVDYDVGDGVVAPPIVTSPDAESFIAGSAQSVEATGVGAVTTSGDIQLFFAGENIDGNPAGVSVPVLIGDTVDVWMAKCRTATNLSVAITANWIVSTPVKQSISVAVAVPSNVSGPGNITCNFMASDVNDEVAIPIVVAVEAGDTSTEVATKIIAEIIDHQPLITAKYDIAGGGGNDDLSGVVITSKTYRSNDTSFALSIIAGLGVGAATSTQTAESTGDKLIITSKKALKHDPTANIGIVENGTGITNSLVSRTLVMGQERINPERLVGEALIKPSATVNATNTIISGVTTKNTLVTLRVYEGVSSTTTLLRLLFESRTLSSLAGVYSFDLGSRPAPRDANAFDVIVTRAGSTVVTRGAFLDIAPEVPFSAISADLTTISGTTEPGATITGSGVDSLEFTGVADSTGAFSIIHTFTADEVVTLTATDAGGESGPLALVAKAVIPAVPTAVAFTTGSGTLLNVTAHTGATVEVILNGAALTYTVPAAWTGVAQVLTLAAPLNYGQVVGVRTVDGTATSAFVFATSKGSVTYLQVSDLLYQTTTDGDSAISGTFAGTGPATVIIKLFDETLGSAAVDETTRFFLYPMTRQHFFGQVFAVTPDVAGGIPAYIERPLNVLPPPNVFFSAPIVPSVVRLAGVRPQFGGVNPSVLTDYQRQVALYNGAYVNGVTALVQSSWSSVASPTTETFRFSIPWNRYPKTARFLVTFPNGETTGGDFTKDQLAVVAGGFNQLYTGQTRTPQGVGMAYIFRDGLPLSIQAFTIQVYDPDTGQKSDKVLWNNGVVSIIESALK